MLAAASLSACSTPRNHLLSPDSLYPVELTVCAPDPAVPPRPAPGPDGKPAPRDDKAKGEYIKDLHDAGQDCRDKVTGVKERRDLYVQQYNANQGNLWQRTWAVVHPKKAP